MTEIFEKAKQFAIAAHDSINHRRKYTDEPYWVHPERVAKMVSDFTKDDAIIAAAWLHDVFEDVAPTNANFNAAAIQREFGSRTLELVLEVTDISKPEDGNRAARKAIDRAHLVRASNDAKLIKLADLIDNVIDITKHDPGFARVFRKEVMLVLPYLESGNQALYVRLKELLERNK